MLYPNLEGQRSLSCNYREAGEHTGEHGAAESHAKAHEIRSEYVWEFTVPLLQNDSASQGTVWYPQIRAPILNLHGELRTKVQLQSEGCTYLRHIKRRGTSPSIEAALATLPPSDNPTDSVVSSINNTVLATGSACLEVEQKYALIGPNRQSDPGLALVTAFISLSLGSQSGSTSHSYLLTIAKAYEVLWPLVRLIVFASESDCESLRYRFAFECFAEEQCIEARAAFSVPQLPCLFARAREYSSSPYLLYANADIAFLPDLLTAVEVLQQQQQKTIGDWTNVVVTGSRFDVDELHLDWEALSPLNRRGVDGSQAAAMKWRAVVEMSRKHIRSVGELHPSFGVDYFLFNADSPIVHELPPFLVGRQRWDNWAIRYCAMHPQIKLIDGTEVVTAAHVGHGQPFASKLSNGNELNRRLAGFDFRHGILENSNYRVSRQADTARFEIEENVPAAALAIAMASWSNRDRILFHAERIFNFTVPIHLMGLGKLLQALEESGCSAISRDSSMRILRQSQNENLMVEGEANTVWSYLLTVCVWVKKDSEIKHTDMQQKLKKVRTSYYYAYNSEGETTPPSSRDINLPLARNAYKDELGICEDHRGGLRPLQLSSSGNLVTWVASRQLGAKPFLVHVPYALASQALNSSEQSSSGSVGTVGSSIRCGVITSELGDVASHLMELFEDLNLVGIVVVGASFGEEALVLSSMLGRRSQIVAVEPVPEFAECLRASVADNAWSTRIMVLEGGICRAASEKEAIFSYEPGNPYAARLFRSKQSTVSFRSECVDISAVLTQERLWSNFALLILTCNGIPPCARSCC
eukprot:scaffold3446_cov393-Prasinococcus_capsulatus_cf.AAC.3